MTITPETACWDLTSLYSAPDAFRLDLNHAAELAATFAADYRGRVAELAPSELAQAYERLEAVSRLTWRAGQYVSLRLALDSADPDRQKANAEADERLSAIGQQLTFFSLELAAAPETVCAAWLTAPELAPFHYAIAHTTAGRPFQLDEASEKLLALKSLVGPDVMVRMHNELLSAYRFQLQIDGEARELTGPQLNALRQHPDPDLRATATAMYDQRLTQDAIPFAAIFNGVLHDHAQDVELRGFADPLDPVLRGHDLPRPAVDSLLDSCERHYDLAQSYWRLKARLLGQPVLRRSDLAAPCGGDPRRYPLGEAAELVFAAFAAFSPEFAAMAQAAFAEGRVDAASRPGKRGGAFCSGGQPGLKPFVLLNHTDTLGCVYTLAHELGHAIHFELSGRQRLVNYHAATPLAEVASGFAEGLLFDALYAAETEQDLRIAMLCERIEGVLGSVFRQAMFTRFEQRAHAGRAKGLLTRDDLNTIWHEEQCKLYGAAVTGYADFRQGWSGVGHFIFSPFYCFSYAFAELLVLALRAAWRQEGEGFKPKFRAFLAQGSSAPPAALMAGLGLDFTAPVFWDAGLADLGRLITELEQLS